MKTLLTRFACLLGLAGTVTVLASSTASAQSLRGGEIRFPAIASGDEMTSQNDLWVMDVYFKPMRLIPVELTDPKTGQKKLEYVWYIVYRGFNHKLDQKGNVNAPVNDLDPPVAPQQFIPEFTTAETKSFLIRSSPKHSPPSTSEKKVITTALSALSVRFRKRRSPVDRTKWPSKVSPCGEGLTPRQIVTPFS